jgi:hypothetical protein
MERAAIKFRVKLKQTATETFEMLKSAYGEACLLRTSVSEWHKKVQRSSESETAKIAGENNVDCIFYVKGIIHHEFVLEKTDCKRQILQRGD